MLTSLSHRRAALAALGLATVFAAIHAMFTLTWTIQRRTPMSVKWWFDLRNDYGIPAWFTFACTALAGIACIRFGHRARRTGPVLAGSLFLFLAIDDATMLHERVGALFAESLSRTGTYAWVLVLGVPIAAAGAWSAWSCWRSLRNDCAACVRVMVGFAALGVAMAIEVCEEKVTHSGIRWRDVDLLLYTQLVEEWLEMVGPVMVAWGAFDAAARLPRRARVPAVGVAGAAEVEAAVDADAVEEEVGAGV